MMAATVHGLLWRWQVGKIACVHTGCDKHLCRHQTATGHSTQACGVASCWHSMPGIYILKMRANWDQKHPPERSLATAGGRPLLKLPELGGDPLRTSTVSLGGCASGPAAEGGEDALWWFETISRTAAKSNGGNS